MDYHTHTRAGLETAIPSKIHIAKQPSPLLRMSVTSTALTTPVPTFQYATIDECARNKQMSTMLGSFPWRMFQRYHKVQLGFCYGNVTCDFPFL